MNPGMIIFIASLLLIIDICVACALHNALDDTEKLTSEERDLKLEVSIIRVQQEKMCLEIHELRDAIERMGYSLLERNGNDYQSLDDDLK